MKTCLRCKITKPKAEFKRLRGVALRNTCNTCRGLKALNPAAHMRFSSYGLTEEDYQKLLKDCGGKCTICKSSDPLHVDHCHTTKKVRGLLCSHCNRGLGCFRDNPELLESAKEYLGRSFLAH